jgi:pyruvate kinase
MRRNRNAKIVATLGPASSSYDTIKNLFLAGVDVFRLNFSHGTHEEHQEKIEIIRRLEKEFEHPIAILMDLQGPKLRVGEFENNQKFTLKKDQFFTLDLDKKAGNSKRVFFPHSEIFQEFKADDFILVNDGKIKLQVVKTSTTEILTKVLVGGEISSRKGINIPQIVLQLSCLTAKDLKDLDFGLKLGVDWVALSFVQTPQDVIEARKIIGKKAQITAKLEKPSAIEHLDEIIRVSDGIMVARGDLGVEMPAEEIPSIQKQIIRKCRQSGKPVVVATQMLESMINSPSPTRAEASDVATAIYEGADAVMLSAESAFGNYPEESVSIMDKIIQSTEKDPLFYKTIHDDLHDFDCDVSYSITAASREIADKINVCVIATSTETGRTTLHMSRQRPKSSILALTPNQNVARFLSLVWGVFPKVSDQIYNLDQMVETVSDIVIKHKIGKKGDLIIITAGSPFGKSGTTNTILVEKI